MKIKWVKWFVAAAGVLVFVPAAFAQSWDFLKYLGLDSKVGRPVVPGYQLPPLGADWYVGVWCYDGGYVQREPSLTSRGRGIGPAIRAQSLVEPPAIPEIESGRRGQDTTLAALSLGENARDSKVVHFSDYRTFGRPTAKELLTPEPEQAGLEIARGGGVHHVDFETFPVESQTIDPSEPAFTLSYESLFEPSLGAVFRGWSPNLMTAVWTEKDKVLGTSYYRHAESLDEC